MERYDSYKDSGVDWIGEIPSHWGIEKLKYFISMMNEKGSPSPTDIRISPENVENGTGVCLDYFSDHFGEGVIFDKGDILLNKLRLYLKKIIYCDFQGFSMGEMIVLRTLKGTDRYHFYTFFHQGLIDGLDVLSTGVKLPRVSPKDILNNPHPFPPLLEQEQIVAYLDRKTTLIDSLIEKTVRKIELLKEKRTSLINEVVTKGLNPDVEMKESGVEWIGEIPSHWSLKRLSWVASTGSGTTPKSSNDSYYSGGTINWLITGDLNDDVVLDTSKKITPKALEECRLNTYPMGSIVVAMYGATIGKLCQLGVETTVNQACCVLSSFKGILPKQVFYRILSSRDYLLFLGDGGGQPNISQEDVRSLQIPTPPLLEQEQIVEFLDEQTSIIDSTITTEEKRIELLKEYRQSLISEVVTGKVKVTRDE